MVDNGAEAIGLSQDFLNISLSAQFSSAVTVNTDESAQVVYGLPMLDRSQNICSRMLIET